MRCGPLRGRHAVDRVWNASKRRSASLSEMRPDLTGTGGGDQPSAVGRLILLRSCLEVRKCMCRLGGTSTGSPVLGLRPTRATRTLLKKLPNPRSSTLCLGSGCRRSRPAWCPKLFSRQARSDKDFPGEALPAVLNGSLGLSLFRKETEQALRSRGPPDGELSILTFGFKESDRFF